MLGGQPDLIPTESIAVSHHLHRQRDFLAVTVPFPCRRIARARHHLTSTAHTRKEVRITEEFDGSGEERFVSGGDFFRQQAGAQQSLPAKAVEFFCRSFHRSKRL